MIPVLSETRALSKDSLWTNKMRGDFEEGDPALAHFIIQGGAEIKELGGHLRIFFRDVQIMKRPFILTEDVRKQLLNTHHLEKLAKKRQAYHLSDEEAVSDSDEDLEDDEIKEKEAKVLEKMITMEKIKTLEVPKLTLFLTSKKPKVRMVDVHKTGTRIRITGASEGIFGSQEVAANYESSLTDIPDALNYQGLVVVKLPEHEPPTDEPIIFGLIKLQSYRSIKIKTSDALHLVEVSEELSKIMVQDKKEESTKRTKPTKDTPSEDGGSRDDDRAVVVDMRKLADRIKPMHVYRKIASKMWIDFQKDNDMDVDFPELLQVLDHMDLFMVTAQARRIFDAVDLGKRGKIGISEFENFLIANDILDSGGLDLVVLDIFDSLKGRSMAILQKEQDLEVERKAKLQEEKTKKDDATLFDTALQATNMPVDTTKRSSGGKQIDMEGLDYSAFLEGIQMLGVKQDDPDTLRQAFCFGGGFKEKEADSKLLGLNEFRRAWLKLADVVAELKKRGIRYDRGLLVEGRNRELLTRSQISVEDNYKRNLGKINEVVESIKHDKRMKSDQKRREQEQFKEKLLHEANKFIALRSQEKRLKLKQEQEERSKKRLEDKMLKNKLALIQQENIDKARAKISESNKQKEKLRNDEVRALGLDKLDLSVQQLRHIPPHLYCDYDAQLKLSYTLYADLSCNILELLPEANFLYWMPEVRVLKLSNNRLKTFPDDMKYLVNLQVLQLDSNRVQVLPPIISKCSSLQRLDISSNQIDEIPVELGDCKVLRYLRLHSNNIKYIPKEISGCLQLEYLDISRNKLIELPESMDQLLSLAHLDFSRNYISSFPQRIGHCISLSYLDASTNQLAYIPESFSALSSLEYCNLDNNSIVTTPKVFRSLSSLKMLSMRSNSARTLYPDFGYMRNMTKLDMSVNSIRNLPLEIGQLTLLQELILHRNQLVTIPVEVGALVNLQRLDLSYNSLEGCLVDSIGLATSLVHLDLSFNRLVQLPRSIVGLQKMVTMKAEKCQLTGLPDTFSSLESLVHVDVSKNKFELFPIELRRMKSLKHLNLSNNFITLLPRNIDTMTNLSELNISKNLLRALPVEFTDVLESVNVTLNENPWTDLPPRWGKMWPNKRCTDGVSNGYTLSDAIDFLYAVRVFYATAEQIWQELGVFHYTNKLNLEDFIQELRDRLPNSWHEGLVQYVKHIYFESRKSGVFTKWYSVDEVDAHERTARMEADTQRRENQVLASRHELVMREERIKMIYEVDVERRIRHAFERAVELEKNKEVKQRIALAALKTSAVEAAKASTKRYDIRERLFSKLQLRETARLQEILDADTEGRELDKRMSREQRRASMDLSGPS